MVRRAPLVYTDLPSQQALRSDRHGAAKLEAFVVPNWRRE